MSDRFLFLKDNEKELMESAFYTAHSETSSRYFDVYQFLSQDAQACLYIATYNSMLSPDIETTTHIDVSDTSMFLCAFAVELELYNRIFEQWVARVKASYPDQGNVLLQLDFILKDLDLKSMINYLEETSKDKPVEPLANGVNLHHDLWNYLSERNIKTEILFSQEYIDLCNIYINTYRNRSVHLSPRTTKDVQKVRQKYNILSHAIYGDDKKHHITKSVLLSSDGILVVCEKATALILGVLVDALGSDSDYCSDAFGRYRDGVDDVDLDEIYKEALKMGYFDDEPLEEDYFK